MSSSSASFFTSSSCSSQISRPCTLLADYHVHTSFSNDSRYLVEDVVCDAIRIGLDEICLCDHVDYGILTDVKPGEAAVVGKDGRIWSNVDYQRYMETIDQLRNTYQDRLVIKAGLELGVQKDYLEQNRRLARSRDWDFLLLSIHEIDNQELWTGVYQDGKSQKEIYEGYYQALLEIIQNFKDYSVLAHLDLIVRYDPFPNPYPFEALKPLLSKILRQAIEDGKGIELNTSSVRYQLKDSTPSRDILQLYHELGGTIITIGSDSHAPEHLGFGLQEAKALLKETGFSYFCTYEQMKPVFHPL